MKPMPDPTTKKTSIWQGDQIGRIFAIKVIANSGQICSKINKSSFKLSFAEKSCALNLTKCGLSYFLGDFSN
jgi:hypothetical protein